MIRTVLQSSSLNITNQQSCGTLIDSCLIIRTVIRKKTGLLQDIVALVCGPEKSGYCNRSKTNVTFRHLDGLLQVEVIKAICSSRIDLQSRFNEGVLVF